MFDHVLNKSVVFKSQNPFLVSDYVNKHIGNHQISLTGQAEESSSLWHTNLNEIALSRITYGNTVRVRSSDLEEIYHFQIVLSGQCHWVLLDHEITLTEGQCILLNPHDRVDLRYSNDCSKIIVKIPKNVLYTALVDQVASIPQEGVRFEHQAQNILDHRMLMHLLGLLFMEAETDDTSSSVLSQYGNLLAVKLLDSFSNNVDVVDEAHQYHRCFTSIDAYIRENIKEDLSVDALATLSKVSSRTLYNIFSRYKSITPMHYIKQQKLLHIRKVLQGQERSVRNVTEVALDYGFMHLGRFSSDYKKLFGELPSETLKKKAQ